MGNTTKVRGSVEHINPKGVVTPRGWSHAAVVTGPAKTIYIGGQNAVDESGAVVGKGDIGKQTEQIFKNIKTVLAACGAELAHVIKWNIYVVQGQPLEPGVEVFQREWGNRPNLPVITVVYVAGLGNPDFMCEIEVVAVVPE